MNRSELLERVKILEPALSGKDSVPILSSIRFDGKTATSYDEAVAISTPCETDLSGCLQGRQLIQFLSASKAKTVEVVSSGDDEAVLKVGKARLRLPAAGLDEFPLELPDDTEARAVPIRGDKLLDGLERASVAMGQDALHLWSYGITLDLGASASAWATNAFSVAHVAVQETKTRQSLILSPRFVEAVLRISRRSKPAKLLLWKDSWVAITFDDGTRVSGRHVPGADPARFRELFDSVVTEGLVGASVPKGLDSCLGRATIFQTSGAISERTVVLKVDEKEKLVVSVEGGLGGFREAFRLTGHPPIRVKAPGELVSAALRFASTIAITERAVVLEGPDFRYIVSVSK